MLTLELVELLHVRFATIWGNKFLDNFKSKEANQMWCEEWLESLMNVSIDCIAPTLKYCKANLEWPPSIAEFVKICDRHSGIPNAYECLTRAIAGNFDHPLISIIADKVGSWELKNGKHKDLQAAFKIAYPFAIIEFKENQKRSWQKLEDFNARKLESASIAQVPKIPSESEFKSWRVRFSEWQEKANVEKEYRSKQEKVHPIWDLKKCNRAHKSYDSSYENQRKKYLLSLNEIQATTLERQDWFDRCSFEREKIAFEKIENYKASLPPKSEDYKNYNKPQSNRKYYNPYSD